MKIQYANEFVQNNLMSDPTTCVYQFIYNEYDSDKKKIMNCLLCLDWYYASRQIAMWHICSMHGHPVVI